MGGYYITTKPKVSATKQVKKVKKKKITYRSGFEKRVATLMKEAGVKFEYEPEKIHYIVPSSKHYYLPDFRLPNGIFVEVKGKLNRENRVKMLLAIEQNPDKDIRFLFMRNNYISKQSQTRYSEWCDKHKIKYHISLNGTVPEEWINEEPKDNERMD
jgi:hypothetical protein